MKPLVFSAWKTPINVIASTDWKVLISTSLYTASPRTSTCVVDRTRRRRRKKATRSVRPPRRFDVARMWKIIVPLGGRAVSGVIYLDSPIVVTDTLRLPLLLMGSPRTPPATFCAVAKTRSCRGVSVSLRAAPEWFSGVLTDGSHAITCKWLGFHFLYAAAGGHSYASRAFLSLCLRCLNMYVGQRRCVCVCVCVCVMGRYANKWSPGVLYMPCECACECIPYW